MRPGRGGLYGSGRNAGTASPQEAGPHLSYRRGLEHSAGAVRGRRRRAAGRHRTDGIRRRVEPVLHRVCGPQRAGAAGRRCFGPLFRGQRGAAGVLRRDHRGRKQQHRHGRPRDDRRRRAGRLSARGDRPDRRAVRQRRGRHPGQGRGRSLRGRQAIPVVFPGGDRGLDRARPAPCPARHPREPAAQLRYPQGRRLDRRRRVDPGIAARLRRRHPDRAGPDRGAALWPDREQPAPSGRRHRRRRQRQGRAVHAAVRRLRPADPVALRLARFHGGARGGKDRAGPARQSHVRHRTVGERADLRRGRAQMLWPGRDGDAGRGQPRQLLHHLVADGRIRPDGAGGCGASGVPQGAGRADRPAGEAGAL